MRRTDRCVGAPISVQWRSIERLRVHPHLVNVLRFDSLAVPGTDDMIVLSVSVISCLDGKGERA
jgi:hypothetical protein